MILIISSASAFYVHDEHQNLSGYDAPLLNTASQ